MHLHDIATKNGILLSPGNIQTPKSLWSETNCTSRLSPNQILQTYTYIRRQQKGKKQAGRRGEPLAISTTENIKTKGMNEPLTKGNYA